MKHYKQAKGFHSTWPQEDSLQGDSVQMSSKDALYARQNIQHRRKILSSSLFWNTNICLKSAIILIMFVGYGSSTSYAYYCGEHPGMFTHQSAVQLCSTISLTFLLYSRLFSLNMRAASEFAGELGFGSQSNDCIREKVDISRLFKQIQMHSI